MKRLLAFVCLMIPAMFACATEPVEPGETAAAAPADEAAGSPIGALADEPCLNYCTGGGRTPFMTCVPVCRRDRQVYFSLEPVNLQLAPYCGDNICQFPEETTRDTRRYCPSDCRQPVEVSRKNLTINGKLIAEAEGENILMRSSAFDAGM